MNDKKLFWKLLNSKYAINTDWFRVRKEVVKLPTGKILKDFYVIENGELVAVIATTNDNRVILVKQYRHAIKDITIDLPGGSVEKGERPIEAARRELLEETGMIAGHLKKILTYYPDSGRTECIKHIFIASDLEKSIDNQNSQDDTENIHLILMPFKKVLNGIRSGELKESTLHIGILAYLNLNKK